MECGSSAAAFLPLPPELEILLPALPRKQRPSRARPRDALSASPFLHRLLSHDGPPGVWFAKMKMTDDKSNPGGDRFPLTRWSVIDAARSGDEAERVRAMDTLCAAYWKPVYKYIRLRWNRPTADAQDLTQGFFVQIIERGLLEKFDPAKSRLRTYLRVCVDSFVMNEDKAAKRLKRGGNASHVALDFTGAEEELGGAAMDPASIPSSESLEDFFEKEWIRGLFELAVEDLRKLCEANERERTFRLFEEYDLAGDETISYEKLAQGYGIDVSDVTNALAWARREFRRGALERLREICGSDEEFQREARAVFGWEAK
jgi:RNA polymerase sigma factor (sigma-70 family)